MAMEDGKTTVRIIILLRYIFIVNH